MIKVIKIQKGQGGYFSIDRQTSLGNPFKISSTCTREESIKQYRSWLWSQIKDRSLENKTFKRFAFLASEYEKAGSLTLGCHCKPLSCHGDVIASAIRWYVGTPH